MGDFGLAREFGSPLKEYTPIVVTLWYRAPELLLQTKLYSAPIDNWSVGCIFGEFITMKALFPGKSEIDQINLLFKELGTPNDKIWPGYSDLPLPKKVAFAEHPYNNLHNRFGRRLGKSGFDLINRFLTYCPERRITAAEALNHEFFRESPKPVDPSMFPTWPAKSEGGNLAGTAASSSGTASGEKRKASPKPPSGGKQFAGSLEADEEAKLMMMQMAGHSSSAAAEAEEGGGGGGGFTMMASSTTAGSNKKGGFSLRF